MTFDTYITIIIGSLLVLAITIILAIISERDNKVGRKNKKTLKWLIVLVAIIGLAVSCYYYISQRNSKRSDYEEIVSEADYEFANYNLEDAARYYHKAFNLAYDERTEAYCLEQGAVCYMIMGLLSGENDSLRKAYLQLQEILNANKYVGTRSYKNALCDMCTILYHLDYSWKDEEWTTLVAQVEQLYDFDNIETIPLEELDEAISAGKAAGYYYLSALSSDPYNGDY